MRSSAPAAPQAWSRTCWRGWTEAQPLGISRNGCSRCHDHTSRQEPLDSRTATGRVGMRGRLGPGMRFDMVRWIRSAALAALVLSWPARAQTNVLLLLAD